MTECCCPADGREVHSTQRVYVYLPGAEVRIGNHIHRDASKVIIFDKDCPVHGYTVLEEEGDGD